MNSGACSGEIFWKEGVPILETPEHQALSSNPFRSELWFQKGKGMRESDGMDSASILCAGLYRKREILQKKWELTL
ncbi:hypothetical protein [Leptospira stimsonii]|uniref:Uncharacterized protein n=1 Tax=Leptospira stimsonii TaxID=2202203 RepID=A0A8B3CY88_9LEPT|nr:hypothetical protein [Leptospira stimsonii]RHX88362.1 hypothetical protein DLM78_05305 [Leptospira stimsonii]